MRETLAAEEAFNSGQAVLEADSVERNVPKENLENDTAGQKEPEQEDEEIPPLMDSSDEEVEPVQAENWIDGVDEEDSSESEDDAIEFELMANEEDRKRKKGFQRPGR